MALDVNNLNLQIQVYLKSGGFYEGALDGKIGPKSYDAIALAIRDAKVNPTGWNKSRLLIAGEQLLYKSQKIDVGIIDGYETPVLQHARDVYKANLTINFRDKADALNEVVPVKPIPVKSTGKIVPVREWPRQKDCMDFYGRPGTNQVDAIMPYELRLAWETKTKVTKFSVHKLVKEPIERVFNRTLDYYGYEKIKELNLHLWGGCLNVRKMRGGSNWSQHAWGIAVDMDPDNNQLRWGKDKAEFAKPAYNKWFEFWYDEGAISLGKERNMDFMHTQFSRL